MRKSLSLLLILKVPLLYTWNIQIFHLKKGKKKGIRLKVHMAGVKEA